jgi:hypothetical protein
MSRKYISILYGLLALVLIWFLLGMADGWLSFRLDMTAEGKYSIGQAAGELFFSF